MAVPTPTRTVTPPTDTSVGSYFEWFERARAHQRDVARSELEDRNATAIAIFNDRATARVNDVASVLLRDAVLWGLAAEQGEVLTEGPRRLLEAFSYADGPATAESQALEAVALLGWTELR